MKMDEEGIPLTTFSAPQGHYEWIAMQFCLKNAPNYFKEEWITFSKILINYI